MLIGYISLIAWIGSRFGKDQHNPEDYFLGGRKIPGWAIGLSVMATQASAITFIGAPGWGFEGGLERLVTFINVPLAMIVLILVLVPIFHRAGIYSIYELLERRFGPATRTLTALLFLIARGLATGVVLYAPALVLAVVTGWSVNLTIIIMAVLAISYTVMGGISAVIWTDVLQMFVLWLGALFSIFFLVTSLPGGWGDVFDFGAASGMFDAIDLSFDPSVTYSLWAGLFGGFSSCGLLRHRSEPNPASALQPLGARCPALVANRWLSVDPANAAVSIHWRHLGDLLPTARANASRGSQRAAATLCRQRLSLGHGRFGDCRGICRGHVEPRLSAKFTLSSDRS